MLGFSKLWLLLLLTHLFSGALSEFLMIELSPTYKKSKHEKPEKENRRESRIWGEPDVSGRVLCAFQNTLNESIQRLRGVRCGSRGRPIGGDRR